MKALILSAGLGTRLAPITNTIPKALAPVNGVPIIFYVLALLKQHGIREFVLNLHHHADKIPELLGDGKKFGVSIQYSREPVILGTGGGIKKMLKMTGDDDVLIANGDVIADFDVTSLIAQHKTRRPLATFVLYKHPQAKKYGLLSYQGQKLLSILNKPPSPPNAEQAMFASFHVVAKARLETLLSKFDHDKMFCIMNDVYIPFLELRGLPRVLPESRGLLRVLPESRSLLREREASLATPENDFEAFILEGFWRACDSLEDIRKVESLLKTSAKPLRYLDELHAFTQNQKS